MSAFTNTLSVTAVSLADSGTITAFFNELPALVVQGKSDEEVKTKLQRLLMSYINRLKSVNDFDINPQTISIHD